MAVLSVHIDDGICRAVKTDDVRLANVEVVTVIDGEPMSSRRPALELEIIRFVGNARERSAIQIAIDAFDRLAERLRDLAAPISLGEATAMWEIAKTQTDRELAAAQDVLNTGGATAAASHFRVAAE